MQQVNDNMTIDEQVAYAWKHREHFAAVARRNAEVTTRRYRGADWTLTENQYRNPWAEVPAETEKQYALPLEACST